MASALRRETIKIDNAPERVATVRPLPSRIGLGTGFGFAPALVFVALVTRVAVAATAPFAESLRRIVTFPVRDALSDSEAMVGALPGPVEVVLEVVERLEVAEVVELDEVVVLGGLPALAPKSKRITALLLCAVPGALSPSVTVIS